jgi:hypothetical protein
MWLRYIDLELRFRAVDFSVIYRRKASTVAPQGHEIYLISDGGSWVLGDIADA